MASNSIGNLSIIISGNANPLTSALSSAQKQVAAFRQKLPPSLGGSAANFSSAFSPLAGATTSRAFAQARRDLEARAARLMGTITRPAPGLFSQAASGTGSFLSAGAGIGKSMLSGLTSFLMTAGPTIGNALGTAISAGSHKVLGFAAAGGAAIKHALEKAMDFQDLLVGFEVMTGSAQQGRQMLETLEKFSATLPFTSGTVMKAARTLAGNGVAMNNILPALQSIATVVAATGGAVRARLGEHRRHRPHPDGRAGPDVEGERRSFERGQEAAEARLAQPLTTRVGQGYDVHRFTQGDHVWLGGIRIPHSHGVAAHSDGDVVLHALTDALLGAIADGDIGVHFPPSDPRWRGASSDHFLADAVARVATLDAEVLVVAQRACRGSDDHRGVKTRRAGAVFMGFGPMRLASAPTSTSTARAVFDGIAAPSL